MHLPIPEFRNPAHLPVAFLGVSHDAAAQFALGVVIVRRELGLDLKEPRRSPAISQGALIPARTGQDRGALFLE